MQPSELLTRSLMIVMALTPLVALTIIAARSRRGRWWMAAPWALLLGLWAGLLQLFIVTGIGGEGPSAFGTSLIGSGFGAAWLTLCVFVAALAIAGPKLPPPGLVSKK